ncbi:hypothetical protein AGLY_002178 [Aphis glycines]|uniref:Uncharacterized protein n=1 Tax=Aphis glycines TaxID=307491 RepID=A0A6G0U2N7_APHGL|nr:hypothetical protein AGLY_002178 [Aphis glycines]
MNVGEFAISANIRRKNSGDIFTYLDGGHSESKPKGLVQTLIWQNFNLSLSQVAVVIDLLPNGVYLRGVLNLPLTRSTFSFFLNLSNPGVNKCSVSIDNFDAMNRLGSMNRIEKLLVTCFENEMYFSSLFRITEITEFGYDKICINNLTQNFLSCQIKESVELENVSGGLIEDKTGVVIV